MKEFNLVVETTHNLTVPIFSKLLFLYIIYYLFAIVGAFLFGGKINEKSVAEKSPGSPAFYYLLNFNSYGASLITLFHFMVINNWFVTIQMYQAVTDNKYLPTLFFVVFWCFVVLVLLNVLISLIIEIYSSVEPEVNEKKKKEKLIR